MWPLPARRPARSILFTSAPGYRNGQVLYPPIDALALWFGIAKPLTPRTDMTGISSFKAAPGTVIKVMGRGFRQHGSAAEAGRFPPPVKKIAFKLSLGMFGWLHGRAT